MPFSVQHQEVDYSDYEAYANTVIGHALRAKEIGNLIGVGVGNVPTSPALSADMLHAPVHVIYGPMEYGGAIKGYSLLGYLEYHAAEMLNYAKTDEAKLAYAAAHGLTATPELLAQIESIHVALWVAFKERAIIAPTSGSFGLAAYQTIEKLRQAEVTYQVEGKPVAVSLLSEKEGKARAWIPHESTGTMTREKEIFIVGEAERLGQEVRSWTSRKTRDHFAMLDALAHGDYFCPTNPKSPAEIAIILREVLENRCGDEAIFSSEEDLARLRKVETRILERNPFMQRAIDSIGAKVEGEKITVTAPTAAGRYGLMLSRLEHLEKLLGENPPVKRDDLYNQPGIGATFAGAVDATEIITELATGKIALSVENQELLAKNFPNLAQAVAVQKGLPVELKLHLAPIADNTDLPRVLGMGGPRYETSGVAVNGLGSRTTKAEGDAVDTIQASQRRNPAILAEDSTPATKAWVVIAQALLYLPELEGKHPAFPEEAGAVSLASALKERYLSQQPAALSAVDLVYALKKEGISKEIFERILALNMPDEALRTKYFPDKDFSNPWSYIEAEAAINQGGDPEFITVLKEAFDLPLAELQARRTPPSKTADHSITVYNTGSNGTQHIHQAIARQILAERKRLREATAGAGYSIQAAINAGWNANALTTYVDYALENGANPNAGMGMSDPMPALALPMRPLADSFRQKYYQLRHNSFDIITDKDRFDASVTVGGQKFSSALLKPQDRWMLEGIPSVSLRYDAKQDYETSVQRLCEEALALAKNGKNVITLTDFPAQECPLIDISIAIRAVRMALDEAGYGETAIIANTAQIQTAHHLAVAIGCGASLVYPHLLYHYAERQQKDITKLVIALEDGLNRAVARTGANRMQDYLGAFHFETLGIDSRDEFLAGLFGKSPLGFGGYTVDHLANHAKARFDDSMRPNGLPDYHLMGKPSGEVNQKKLISQEFVDGLRQIRATTSTELPEIDGYTVPSAASALYMKEAERLKAYPVALRHLFDLSSTNPPAEPGNLRNYLDAYQIAGMAYGAVKPPAHHLMAEVAAELGIHMNTGAGPLANNKVQETQLATGRYGVTAKSLLNAEVVEIKIAQGSSPGEVGQFGAARVDVDMAKTRHSLPNTILPNASGHYDIQNLDELSAQVQEIRNLFSGAKKPVKISVKLVATEGVGDLAVELARRGVDMVKITGDSGGTVGAPSLSVNHVGLPTELGVRDAHRKLTEAGLRDQIQIVQSGDANTPQDIAFAYLNGADVVESGKGALMHLAGCEMTGSCMNCPNGITSNEAKFEGNKNVAKRSLLNLVAETAKTLAELGYDSPQAARGKLHEVARLRSTSELEAAEVPTASTLRMDLFLTEPQVGAAASAEPPDVIKNLEIDYGSRLAGEASIRTGRIKEKTHKTSGVCGNGYGAYLSGDTLHHEGEVGRFAGKSMSSGTLSVKNLGKQAVGDGAFFAATGGKANIFGDVGAKFMVANSGTDAVVEGNLGSDAFREMRRGSAIILGEVGPDAFKGCYGGIFAVYDPGDKLMDPPSQTQVYRVDALKNHTFRGAISNAIRSRLSEFCGAIEPDERSIARKILADPEEHLSKFKLVIPHGMRLDMEKDKAQDLRTVLAEHATGLETAVCNAIAQSAGLKAERNRVV